MEFNRKEHWENIYTNKTLESCSWYQPTPETSLAFIQSLNLDLGANIADIGAGDSYLVDNLLDLAYNNISVLDISSAAIDRAKQRLGEKAKLVKWIVSDVLDFEAKEQFDLWHDRAAFHFLTKEEEIEQYSTLLKKSLKKNGVAIIATFSKEGPTKCSGIEIKQYSVESLTSYLGDNFDLLKSEIIDHPTPFGTKQNFIFCAFKLKD